uniref:Protein MEMO1 n=1 Tax=Monodon monoceros TaxID=40151 RepID=A0A8C6C2T5_MONMO
MSNRVVCREASHAGSWYTASGRAPGRPALPPPLPGPAPGRPRSAARHAGYTYCGSCAAHAYKQVDPSITHKDEFTIIPVLVGALSESKEQEFGKLFSKYLADPSNLFVVSSDFCHWGQRFRYSYYDESQGEIYRSIEHLDKMGMSIIEQLDPVSFSNYLKKYHNTICGRHPIGVLLNAITELQKNGMNMSFSFLNYAQSSQCRNWQDSSVSYAAGALTVH